ncbi:50S ribosomal protein L34 [Hathewaya histolytica]|uniref:Uncharacterized protein n=1 Tax=Hathewaya histolytica TaxID=1498 RepID=A0A4U9RCJ5_HATHI|nr:Uncharacterised protein [Hathewaya histolytica]
MKRVSRNSAKKLRKVGRKIKKTKNGYYLIG